MSWLTRTIYAPASISYWPGLSTLGYGLSLFVLTSIVNTPSRTSLSPPLPFSLGYDLSFPSPSWGMECERVYRSVRGLRAISIYYIRSIITITHPIIAGFDIWPGLYWPNPNFSYRQFETSAKACSLSTILHALANRSTEYRRVYARWQGGDGRQNVNACWRSIVQLSVISQSYLLRGRKEQVNVPFQFWLSSAELFVGMMWDWLPKNCRPGRMWYRSKCCSFSRAYLLLRGSCSFLPRAMWKKFADRFRSPWNRIPSWLTATARYMQINLWWDMPRQEWFRRACEEPNSNNHEPLKRRQVTHYLVYTSGSRWAEPVWKIEPKVSITSITLLLIYRVLYAEGICSKCSFLRA